MTRRFIVFATLGGLLAVAGAPMTPTSAQQVPERPQITISGTTTDPFGDPIEVCVFIRHGEVRYGPVTGSGEGQLTDPTSGQYSFEVPQGVYDLWAYSPIESRYSPGPCPDPNPWNRTNTETYLEQGPHRVTALEDRQVDFELPFRLMGGTIDAEGCCGATASAPGGVVGIRAWTSRLLRDRVTVYWRDLTSGTVVELPRDAPSWSSLYDIYGCEPEYVDCVDSTPTRFTMPQEDGAYPYELWAEAADGTVVSEVRTGTAWVDTVAPVIERVEPPDEARGVYADAVRFQLDGYDVGPRISRVRVVLTDTTDPDAPTRERWLRGYDANESFYGWVYDLDPEHTYTAVFTAIDRAGNSATASSTFLARRPAPDDCDLACRAPFIVEGLRGYADDQLS